MRHLGVHIVGYSIFPRVPSSLPSPDAECQLLPLTTAVHGAATRPFSFPKNWIDSSRWSSENHKLIVGSLGRIVLCRECLICFSKPFHNNPSTYLLLARLECHQASTSSIPMLVIYERELAEKVELRAMNVRGKERTSFSLIAGFHPSPSHINSIIFHTNSITFHKLPQSDNGHNYTKKVHLWVHSTSRSLERPTTYLPSST